MVGGSVISYHYQEWTLSRVLMTPRQGQILDFALVRVQHSLLRSHY